MPGMYALPENETSRKQYLDSIYSTVILKDVIERHKIRQAHILDRISQYCFQNIGGQFSARKVAGYLTSTGQKTSIGTVIEYSVFTTCSCNLFSRTL